MRLRTHKRTRDVWSVGVRVGYWHCIPAPFLQVTAGHYYRSFWLERKGTEPWLSRDFEGQDTVRGLPPEEARHDDVD